MELDRKQKIIAGVAAAVVVCGLGLGIAWGAGAFGSDDPDTTPVVTTAEAEEDQIAEGTVSVDFSLTGDGWEEGSSPFIAHVTGETAAGDEVDFYHAVWPDGSTDAVPLEQGTYEVSYVSAINADGSIYKTADVLSAVEVTYDDVTAALSAEGDEAEAATAVTEEPETSGEDEEETVVSEPAEADPEADADADTEDAEEVDTTTDAVVTVPVEEEFEKVDAADVTQEDLEEILDDLNEAVAGGDETLTGDAASEVVDTATGNAQNNPNADGDAIEEKKEEAATTVEETTDTSSSSSSSSSSGSSSSTTSGSTSGSGSSGSSSSGSSSSGSSGSTSGGGSSTSASGSSTSGSSGSTSTSGSTSSHTHSWVAQTTQKWVVDQAAYTEQVSTPQYVCYCGETFTDLDSWNSHAKSNALAGKTTCGGYSKSYVTESVYHAEVGHYETVTTGYKCSTCGATK